MKTFGSVLAIAVSIGIPAAAQQQPSETIDLASQRVQQIRRNAPRIEIHLAHLLPDREYRIAETNAVLETATGPAGDPQAKLCEKPVDNLWGRLRAATDEAAIKEVLNDAREGVSECDASKQAAVVEAIRDAGTKTTRAIPTPISLMTPATLTIQRDGADPWHITVARSDATLPSGYTPELLNEIQDRMVADTSPTILECSYPERKCETDPLFVNADHVSAIVFRGVPTGKELTVVADPLSQPYEGCVALRQNRGWWNERSTPDTVVVTLHMFRRSLLRKSRSRLDAALRLYGLNNEENRLSADEIQNRCSALVPPLTKSYLFTKMGLTEEISGIPILVDGLTEQVKVTFYSGTDAPKSFVIPFNYQRWWVDAGGAFLFPQRENEILSLIPQPDGQVKVVAIESERSVKPETGIVLNLHPGNYPEFAVQFGLATGGESAVSYYLGPALRMREIGKRGLATFSAGVVLVESQQYAGLEIARSEATSGPGFYAGTDPRLQGRREYELQWYLGISLGFSFGGVSSGAETVKQIR